MNDIVKTLELMCDKDNSQDKKLLLLAELVKTKYETLADNQKSLKDSLEKTNDKLDKLTELLEKYENVTESCPVYKNRDNFENLIIFIKNPKMAILIILGVLTLLTSLCGTAIWEQIKFLFDL